MTHLPVNWTVAPLVSLCRNPKADIVDGPFGSNLKRSDYVASGMPVLKIQNVKPNRIVLKKMDFVTEQKYRELERHSFRDGDIIMTKLGDPLGVAARVVGLGEGLIVADLVRLRVQGIDPEFLCYQLNSPLIQRYINGLQKGTTRPRVNLGMIRDLPIVLPPLDEQRRIVTVLEDLLGRLDNALSSVDSAARRIALLRRLVTRRALADAESGSQHTLVHLADVVENLDRLRVPVSASERANRPGHIPYYGATGQVGTIDDCLFDEDLILLGEDGVMFFDPDKTKAYAISGPSWVNNHAHVLRARTELVDDRYLLHFLNAFDYHGYANGTTRLKLTQAAMNRIPLSLPSISVQREVASFIDESLSRLDRAVEILGRAEKLVSANRASLLLAALSGDLSKEMSSV